MPTIDLNCDLGESYGAYRIGMDEEVIPYITSANIACGYHAGDPVVMERTAAMCRAHGVCAGAHPGFPDLMGFGRRRMDISPEEAAACVIYQVGAMRAFCGAAGIRLRHVKLHGALYNMAGADDELALAICRAIKRVDRSLILLALSGSAMVRAAEETGLSCASEVFADRSYMPDGSLMPRKMAGAMIEDEELAIQRVIRMAKEDVVTASDGTDIPIRADSVCVHGDGPKALEFVKKIRIGLEKSGIEVRPFGMGL